MALSSFLLFLVFDLFDRVMWSPGGEEKGIIDKQGGSGLYAQLAVGEYVFMQFHSEEWLVVGSEMKWCVWCAIVGMFRYGWLPWK